jgi:hypothetical protein
MVKVEDDASDDFELITSIRQLAEPPPLRTKTVTLPDWKTQKGKSARFLVWELTALGFADYLESGRTYTANIARYDAKDEDIRLVAHTVRDQHGNRIWNTTDSAKTQLGPLGKSSLNLLLNAANEVNSAKPSSAEGNSEPTTSDSSPST